MISAMHTPPALLLDRTTVAHLLDLDECIAAVERAFSDHAHGRTLAPALMHGDGIGGEFHIKGGGLHEPRPIYACKVNSGFFQNRARFGLPAIQGLILLYDAENGIPLAVMESATVTRLRTGAATAVAARHLALPDAGIACICGSGVQAAIQLRSLARVRPLREVRIWSRTPQRAVEFAATMRAELALPVEAFARLEDATRGAELIVTCTPAKAALLRPEHVRPGAFVAAVGADSPDKIEIDPALMARAAVVCDLTAQCCEVGDLHHALAAGTMRLDDVRAELGAVIAGFAPGRKSADEIVLFDSTGTALQDAAAAVLVYERAIAAQRGTRFGFWS